MTGKWDPLEMMDDLIDLIINVKDGHAAIEKALGRACEIRAKWILEGADFGSGIQQDEPPGWMKPIEARLYREMDLLRKAYAQALDVYYGTGMGERSVVLARVNTLMKEMTNDAGGRDPTPRS